MHALSVKQLSKTYSNGIIALQGIDLAVAEGDFFGLLGQNGAGKSTTIGIISSLVNKTAGEVHIFGQNLDTHLEQAKALIGIVPQEINFGLFENIVKTLVFQAGYYGIPEKIAIKRAEYYLKKMGLWHMRTQPAMRLSGGMKRRLMIARALMNEPKLLILDEPTAGVDVELRHTLWEFLNELNKKGTTIILTTHYLEEAEHLCKNIAIIDKGKIIEHATTKSLLNRLQTQTIILDLRQPLAALPQLEGYAFHLLDDSTLEVEITFGRAINELFLLLSHQHIDILSMRNKTNRLEELFIRLISDNKNEG